MGLVVVKKSPVSIVAVKISEQRIHDKDIPEMLPQFYRRYILLLVNGVHHIFQFRAAAVAIRVENCVFDRAEVEQALAACCKVLAGTDNFCFAFNRKGSKFGFLRVDSN